ncbi:zinc ribbon domain-containing protein [Methanosarcina horonobensis]|nr:zinc ribbon domain-containing protein [Methanosarcina horonobensis]
MELRIFAGWTKESNMPATYLHLSGADIEKKLLAKNGIIEDDSKEREEELKPAECPRCKTKNPVGAKYCYICSMILDHKLAVDVQDIKTVTVGQADNTMMLELLNLVKKFNETQ